MGCVLNLPRKDLLAPSPPPKIRVEVVVFDDDVPKTVHVITTSAHTGDMGDGRIFVLPVENAVRVRTSEAGENAI